MSLYKKLGLATILTGSLAISGCYNSSYESFDKIIKADMRKSSSRDLARNNLRATVFKRENSDSKTGFSYSIDLGILNEGERIFSSDGKSSRSDQFVQGRRVLTTDYYPGAMVLRDYNKDGVIDAKIMYAEPNDKGVIGFKSLTIYGKYEGDGENGDVFFNGGIFKSLDEPVNELGISNAMSEKDYNDCIAVYDFRNAARGENLKLVGKK